jgi:hypothetical protein
VTGCHLQAVSPTLQGKRLVRDGLERGRLTAGAVLQRSTAASPGWRATKTEEGTHRAAGTGFVAPDIRWMDHAAACRNRCVVPRQVAMLCRHVGIRTLGVFGRVVLRNMMLSGGRRFSGAEGNLWC